jgi:hypothetical protein
MLTDPAVSVFGWGTWLQDNGGTLAAQSLVKTMKAKAVCPRPILAPPKHRDLNWIDD